MQSHEVPASPLAATHCNIVPAAQYPPFWHGLDPLAETRRGNKVSKTKENDYLPSSCIKSHNI